MRILLAGMMALLLLRAPETMAAAEAACALFVRSVMPGLFPYLTLSQMLVSRCGRDMQPGMLMLLGWCGGSPTGARLLAMQGSRPHREQKALAVSCATMSPMFLLGTIGSWLNSRIAGAIVLLSVLAVLVVSGSLFGWYESTPLWVLIFMGIAVYVIGCLVDVFRIRSDVDLINRQLQLRRKTEGKAE